jgi:hypothetical protein
MPTFFFHSGMAGAPTNTNAAGSTLEIIRSCLVTGFNLRSVVSASVASEVMTLNFAAPHGYEDKVWLRLDGAAGGSIVQRVTTATGASTLTIPAPGFADGAVAGTLSTRVAPADWEEVFTGTLKAVFRSKVEGPGSTRFFYRVSDDVVTSEPRILRGFESMTDVDSGIGPFPTLTQETGNGVTVFRPSGGTMAWAAVCDGRTIYLTFQGTISGSNRQSIWWFGDEQPIGNIDSFCAAVGGGGGQFANTLYYRPRNAAGALTGQSAAVPIPTWRASYQPYPAPVELGGGLVIVKPVISYATNSATSGVRSVIRGAMAPTANPISSGVYLVLDGITGVQGRVAFFLGGDISAAVVMAFSIDEDWV